MGRIRGWLSSVWAAGILAGIIGLAISFSLRDLMPARPLGDPLPVMLSISQVTRGFIYFPWRPLLLHLFFALSLGVLSFGLLWILLREQIDPGQAARAGQIAAVINVGVVALLSIDAVVVGFWYLISALASVIITGLSARWAAGVWRRRRQSN